MIYKSPVFHGNRAFHLLYQPHLRDYLDQKQLIQLIIYYPLLGIFISIFYYSENSYVIRYLFSTKYLQITDNSKLYGMDSFLTGIKRDHIAVFNAGKYIYINELTGGSVNKTKLVKRIMFGRNSSDLLRKKILLWEVN